MNIRTLLAFILFLYLPAGTLSGQVFLGPDDQPLNGYSAKISGLDYDYHSCIPGLRESLLVRATGGKDFLEWETGPAINSGNRKYLAFIWVAAIGSSPGRAGMVLTSDQGHRFNFFTDGKPSWKIDSPDGSSLAFNSIIVDQYGDHHGYMVLRVPVNGIKTGVPLRLKVTGQKNDLTSWYMTYKKEVKTGVALNTFPAIIKKDNKELQLVEAAIFYFGNEAEAKIYADKNLISKATLKFGYNAISTGLPLVSKPEKIKLRVVAGTYETSSDVTLYPVRKWKVDFIQHSHTDIGYTRSQTEILAEHLRYIDYALDYCDATDNYPDNAKFRWTCEAAWPVDEYLKCRPESQVKRLIQRIKEGRIEVTGMYFNFDEIPDEQILSASLGAAGRIKARGIPVTTAMQNDVNGIGWCLNDYFNQLGVKYLDMGTHGHRALICFDKPTMFWWESPSGKRILTFRAEHYMTGNTVFEIQSGDMNKFRTNLLNYLRTLESKQYPFDEISIQHSGYLTDNSPPSTTLCELIKQWNDTFEWPKISTSLTETFFRNMEIAHAGEFPVIRGAWPDWWTDGFGAASRETAATRKAATSLLANVGGLSMAAISGSRIPEETFWKTDLANEALLFYTEHTAGYSESVREPYSLQTMEQRALKDSYAWEANRRVALLGEEALGLLQDKFTREKEPSLLVFNTLSWPRSGVVTVYIDHQIVPRGNVAGVFDKQGNRYPAQAASSRSDGTYWNIRVKEIPAFGYVKLLIRPVAGDEPLQTKPSSAVLENKWYRIVADVKKGTVSSWLDKELSKELIDKRSGYGFAEFILEKLGNRSQMESKKLDDFKRIPLDTVWFDSAITGPVYSSLKFFGETETAIGPRGFTLEIRLYNEDKLVEIACSLVKKSIVDPESFYIAFPFALENGKHFTELQGGVIETGKDQIPGSSNDWFSVQNFTAIRNSESQIVLSCNEMPLFQFGAINTGRYKAGATPQSTNLFSWPMNNYWVTNFNADQRGGHSWSYFITSSSDVSNGFSTRFGWGSRVPMLARILPGGGSGDDLSSGSYIKGWPDNLLLISSMPLKETSGVVLHVREIAGKVSELILYDGITGSKLKLTETDATGNRLPATDPVIKPYESRFFIVNNAN